MIRKEKKGEITYDEFEKYYLAREQEWKQEFNSLASSVSSATKTSPLPSSITLASLHTGLKKLGIHVTPKEVQELLSTIDKNHDNRIDYDEFRKFLMSMPTVKAKASLEFFLQNVTSQIDYGQSEFSVPQDEEKSNNQTSKYKAANRVDENSTGTISSGEKLICGAVAGCMSRTGSAPIDRLKVEMQAGRGMYNNRI